jgi:hypothetical protein
MLIVCSLLVVPLKTTMEKSRYDVQNISDERTHCVLVRRKILFVNLVKDKHCFVFPLHLQFFKFCNYHCAFWVNYSPPQIRNTCAPN